MMTKLVGDVEVRQTPIRLQDDICVVVLLDAGDSFQIGSADASRLVHVSGAGSDFVGWIASVESLVWWIRCRRLAFDGDVWEMAYVDGVCRLSFTVVG